MTVDHADPQPLWEQLRDVLRAGIQRGDYGDWLPSESQLQQLHGVSRGTVRRAVRALEDEGLVRVIQARGAYILR